MITDDVILKTDEKLKSIVKPYGHDLSHGRFRLGRPVANTKTTVHWDFVYEHNGPSSVGISVFADKLSGKWYVTKAGMVLAYFLEESSDPKEREKTIRHYHESEMFAGSREDALRFLEDFVRTVPKEREQIIRNYEEKHFVELVGQKFNPALFYTPEEIKLLAARAKQIGVAFKAA